MLLTPAYLSRRLKGLASENNGEANTLWTQRHNRYMKCPWQVPGLLVTVFILGNGHFPHLLDAFSSSWTTLDEVVDGWMRKPKKVSSRWKQVRQ